MKRICKYGHDTFVTGRNTKGACTVCQSNYHKQYKKDHKELLDFQIRNCQFKANFGITVSDYDRMFAEQNGLCFICKKSQLDCKRRFAVDHDHKTGKVRSLLCNNCNLLLGIVKDDVNILRQFIDYLENSNRIPN